MQDDANQTPKSKKSLKAECEREIEIAKQNPDCKELFPIGFVEEFDPKELHHPPPECKIFISDEVVYSYSWIPPMKTRIVEILSNAIYSSLDEQLAGSTEWDADGGEGDLSFDATDL